VTNGPINVPATVADLQAYHRNEVASFHMPGHKQRGGHHPLAATVLGDIALRNDVSEMGGYDYLHAPDGALVSAQKASAQIFGAQSTSFLVNGSTVGNLAAVLSHSFDGDTVVMLRGSHRSVYTAVALSGATPSYVPMRHDEHHDCWFVAEAPESAPANTRIVHVTRPNYYGMAIDLAPYRALADATGAVLIVDEAHGAHFGSDPAVPQSALQQGADIVIQSTHKTLSALTQASMLHVGADSHGRVKVDALRQSLAMLQSSSPSALLTMSLDLAAEEHARNNFAAVKRVVALAVRTRAQVTESLHEIHLLTEHDFPTLRLDPTKFVLDVSALGLTGFDARSWLKSCQRINVELADHRRIVCSLTVGDDESTANLLVEALTALDRSDRGLLPPVAPVELPAPTPALTPRLAVQASATQVRVDDAAGRTCAEYLIPYPPGIPLAAPGEVLTAEVLRALTSYVLAGARIVGPADATLRTVRVVT
jgi:arginine decarboxylase